MLKQQAEEPPWLASRNPSGSLTLSEFSGHGKPGICVSLVPTQNATGIQWEAGRKREKIPKQPASKIPPESMRQHLSSGQRSASKRAEQPRQSPADHKPFSLPTPESSSSSSSSCSTAKTLGFKYHQENLNRTSSTSEQRTSPQVKQRLELTWSLWVRLSARGKQGHSQPYTDLP